MEEGEEAPVAEEEEEEDFDAEEPPSDDSGDEVSLFGWFRNVLINN